MAPAAIPMLHACLNSFGKMVKNAKRRMPKNPNQKVRLNKNKKSTRLPKENVFLNQIPRNWAKQTNKTKHKQAKQN